MSEISLRKTLSHNLRYHRRRRGLTQAQLAEAAGTSPAYIGHLERGERDPSIAVLGRLIKSLHLTATELYMPVLTRDDVAQAREELLALLTGKSVQDVRLVLRVARAIFEDPRIGTRGREARLHNEAD